MGLSDQAPNPRALATQALQRILDSGQALDEALEVLSRGLKPEDRGLLRAIVMASLRHKGSIEFLLTRYLSRALPKSGRLAHLALLSGAAQLLFIGVPAHAAVNEQVSLLPEDSKFRVSSMPCSVVSTGMAVPASRTPRFCSATCPVGCGTAGRRTGALNRR